MGDGEAVDICGGGGGLLVQNKESTDFRSLQVGISVNKSTDVTTLTLDKILFHFSGGEYQLSWIPGWCT